MPKECCEGKTTPYCDECGSPIQGYPLIEIKVYFESRLKSAEARLKERQADARADKRPAGISTETLNENVAKAAAIVARWTRWAANIEKAMLQWSDEDAAKPAAPVHRDPDDD